MIPGSLIPSRWQRAGEDHLAPVRRKTARKGTLNAIAGKWASDPPFDPEELFKLE
jgi:hypothetical protein